MNALIKKNFLYYWLKVVFNKVDESRLKAYGPDRVCSEWLIRNGGKVKFLDSKDYSSDYDELQRYQGVRYIDEVDATEAAITHHGFDHFIGCKHIEKIILNNCPDVCDQALFKLTVLKNSLKHLEVYKCGKVTDEGLRSLDALEKLQNLFINDIPLVKDRQGCLVHLQEKLPRCTIRYPL